jgi:hypothetical protein
MGRNGTPRLSNINHVRPRLNQSGETVIHWPFTRHFAGLKTHNRFSLTPSIKDLLELAFQAFAALSRRPELASKISLFVALSPIAYVYNTQSPVFKVLFHLDMTEIFEFFGVKKFLTSTSFITTLSPYVCNAIPTGCDTAIYLICGPTNQINQTRLQVYVSQAPAGTSVKTMVHWYHQLKKDVFGMFDYGSRLV